jgi:hypothetical protein
MLDDRGDKSAVFPKYVGETVKMSRKKMKYDTFWEYILIIIRDEIKEFLIENEDK